MNMNMNVSLAPLVSLIAGILILVAPRLLNYIVAIYLILIGIIGLFGGERGSYPVMTGVGPWIVIGLHRLSVKRGAGEAAKP